MLNVRCKGYTLRGDRCKRIVLGKEFCHNHTNKHYEDMPDECIVCLEKFDIDSKPLLCGHWIHPSCIVKSGKAECPICRAEVKLNREDTARLNEIAYEREQERIQEEHQELVDQIMNDNLGYFIVMVGDINDEDEQSIQQLITSLLQIHNMINISTSIRMIYEN